jgi:hypothetical protein
MLNQRRPSLVPLCLFLSRVFIVGFSKRSIVRAMLATLVVLLLQPTAHAASLTLEWDRHADPSVVGYFLSYGRLAGQYQSHLNVGFVTRFTVSGLLDKTSYCFAVRAYTTQGVMSNYSTAVCGTTGVVTTTTSPARITVNAGGNLQAALDAARAGDTIVLQAGAVFVGNFVLPQKGPTQTSYITIRSSADDTVLPGPGVRMTPAYAAKLPKLKSPNDQPALSTAPGAHHYRLQFLEFLPSAVATGTIVELGDELQTSLDVVPHHLTVDRVYIHGDPTRGQTRGVALHSASTEMTNSYISNIKAVGVDSQAIAGWNGPGPYVIVNNYLEAAGQNVLFGAKAPAIPTLVPANITLRRNHISKPLAWKTLSWTVQNLLELRSATKVVVDGNLFENGWRAGRSNYAIVIRSANSALSLPWSEVHDVKFSNNTVRNVSGGVLVTRDAGADALPVSTITIRNNFFDRINKIDALGIFVTINGVPDVTIDHNTVVNAGVFGLVAGALQSSRLIFTNNIMINQGSVVAESGNTSAGLGTIARYFPQGQFFGGVYLGVNKSLYPVGNYYPSTIAGIGFVDYLRGNYRLSALSLFQDGGTDGTDPGCDFDALQRAQK